MDQLSGGLSLLRCGSFCIAVAFLLTQVSAETCPSSVIQNIGEFPTYNGLGSESPIKGSGRAIKAALLHGEPLVPAVQNFTYRISRLAEEPQKWPKLEFGWRTVSAVILGGVGAALSSAGGLGGGGIFVPMFNLLLQFDAKTSAALSNFMILGGSLANLSINLRQRHPIVRHKPLIDFDVVLLLEPNMLLGISTGVILNVILPDWVITALLAITLGYMTIHIFKGGLRRWNKETNQSRQRKIRPENGSAPYVTPPDFHHHYHHSGFESDDDDIPSVTENLVATDEEIPKGSNSNTLTAIPLKNYSENEYEEASLHPLASIESSKNSSFPAYKVLALACTWLAFFAIQVLRGSKGSKSILGLQACGFGYWLVTLSQVPLAFCITAWTIRPLGASHAGRLGSDVPQQDGFALTQESSTLLAWMALVGGLLGGLLGIGGGMIVNPLLLSVGITPQVTAGTCASMVFFSSSMSVVQFW